MWRVPLRESRCIVPAIGWYEWKEIEHMVPATGEIRKTKQPYFIRLWERRIFAFAGLMSASFKPGSTEMELSCSILTKQAEGTAGHIHSRMPVVLPENAHVAWLDADKTDAGTVLDIARRSVAQVEYHPVSTRVNHSSNEGAELLEPFDNAA